MPTIVLVVLTKHLGAWHPEPQQLATPQPASLTRAWVLMLTSPAGRFCPLLYSCPSYCYMTWLPPFCLPYIVMSLWGTQVVRCACSGKLLWVQCYSQCCSVGFKEALSAKLERGRVKWIHKRVSEYKTKVWLQLLPDTYSQRSTAYSIWGQTDGVDMHGHLLR